jgi:thiol-disulfide isomerase/thioredoxin
MCALAFLVTPLLFASALTVRGAPPADSLPPVIPVSMEQLMEKVKEDSGQVVLVNAWASWCKPCQEELPALMQITEKYYSRGFRLILIAIDDTDIVDQTIRPLLQKVGARFTSYILVKTPDDVFIAKMNSEWTGALPASFIFDRNGKPARMMVGGKTYQQFEEIVNKLLLD